MQIQLLGNRVAVEKLQQSTKQNDGFLVMPEAEEYMGVIRYVGKGIQAAEGVSLSGLTVGQKVYFGTTFQRVRLTGMDVCVMEESNVLAVVKDEV